MIRVIQLTSQPRRDFSLAPVANVDRDSGHRFQVSPRHCIILRQDGARDLSAHSRDAFFKAIESRFLNICSSQPQTLVQEIQLLQPQ